MKIQSKKLNPPFSIKTNGRKDAKKVIELLIHKGFKSNEPWNKAQLKEKYYDKHLNRCFVNVNSKEIIEMHTHSCNDDIIDREDLLKEILKPEYDPKDVAFKNDVYSNSEFNSETFETKCGHVYTENKKIIGYKLIKTEYKEAAELIAFNHIPSLTNRSFIYQNGSCFTEDCKVKDNLEEAGVMHWFEPVFDTSITLKSGVKLSEDDIAEVKEILNTGNRNNNLI